MENQTDHFFAEEIQEQIPLPYTVKPKKKRSPFENSDYITPFETQDHTYAPVMQEKKKKERTGSKFWKGFLCTILILALVGASCCATAYWVDQRWTQKQALTTKAMEQKLQALQKQLQEQNTGAVGGAVSSVEGALTPGQVYAQNVSAVVAVSNYATSSSYGQTVEGVSYGSGFIITEDGYVVSNYHVVEGATKLIVTTYDGTEYTAELVGYDANNDISLLKIDAEGLPCVTVGSSDALVVGDQVVAIGNALGELNYTLTVGYVSAKDRIVTTEGTTLNMLQTDAAINAGNSGGPLLNMYGEVIGITTAKFSGTSESGASIEGIGFAIPMDDVMGMLEDIKDFGYVTGAYLGVMVRDVDTTAQSYGLPAGAYVEEVTEGYAAQRAGLQAQDIIINLGGYDVTCVTDLTRVLRKFEANETVVITVYRAGQRVDMSITLDEKPVQTTAPEENTQQQQQQQPEQEQGNYWDPFGFLEPFLPNG